MLTDLKLSLRNPRDRFTELSELMTEDHRVINSKVTHMQLILHMAYEMYEDNCDPLFQMLVFFEGIRHLEPGSEMTLTVSEEYF